MSSVPGPSRSGAGDGDGTGGWGERPTTSVTGAVGDLRVRHSRGVILQLRVIVEGIKRLTKERKSLKDVQKYIEIAVQELDKEILQVTKMGAIAEMASNFQHGANYQALMLEYEEAYGKEARAHGPSSSPAKTLHEEPIPGPSSTSVNAATSATDDMFNNLMNQFCRLDESAVFEDTKFEFAMEEDAFDMEEVLAEIRTAAIKTEPTENSESD